MAKLVATVVLLVLALTGCSSTGTASVPPTSPESIASASPSVSPTEAYLAAVREADPRHEQIDDKVLLSIGNDVCKVLGEIDAGTSPERVRMFVFGLFGSRGISNRVAVAFVDALTTYLCPEYAFLLQ